MGLYTTRRQTLQLAVGALASSAVACTQAVPVPPFAGTTPTARPSVPSAPTAPRTYPASPSASALAQTAAATPGTGYDPSAWAQILAAAKHEGKVVFLGSTSTELARLLTNGFTAAYPDIAFEYNAVPTQQMSAKVLTEVAANDAQEDVMMTGSTTALLDLIPAGAAEDMTSYLVGPNSTDQSAWRGGHFTFADSSGKYDLEGVSYVQAAFAYNTDVVDPSQFHSWMDLLASPWKGKIAMLDPRTSGGGGTEMVFWYLNPQLGMSYIQQFLAQDPTFSKDDEQLIDWLGQGQYPLVLSAGEVPVEDAIRKGLPIQYLPGNAMQEGSYVTPGSGTFLVVHNPPHPNAAKVFVDWLVSQDGATAWSQGAGYPSLRQDVTTDGIPAFEIPQPGVQYFDNGAEQNVRASEQILATIRPLLPQ